MLGSKRICFRCIPEDAIIFNVPLRSIKYSPKTGIREYPVVGAVVIALGWSKQVGNRQVLHQLAIPLRKAIGVGLRCGPTPPHDPRADDCVFGRLAELLQDVKWIF